MRAHLYLLVIVVALAAAVAASHGYVNASWVSGPDSTPAAIQDGWTWDDGANPTTGTSQFGW